MRPSFSDRISPPRLATALLRRSCPTRRLEEAEGDLEEVFSGTLAQRGRRWAQAVYWKEVLLFVCWPLALGYAWWRSQAG